MPKRAGKPTYFPGKRGRSKNFFVSKVNAQLSLSTLTNDTVITGVLLNLTQDAYLISADLTWSILNLTAGEGPLRVGLNNSILSVTEIAEALDASPNSQDDRIAIERTRRPVRDAGQFPGLNSEEVLNNGNIFRTKVKMVITSARNLEIFARNLSGATLTTGSQINVVGKVYGNWK